MTDTKRSQSLSTKAKSVIEVPVHPIHTKSVKEVEVEALVNLSIESIGRVMTNTAMIAERIDTKANINAKISRRKGTDIKNTNEEIVIEFISYNRNYYIGSKIHINLGI